MHVCVCLSARATPVGVPKVRFLKLNCDGENKGIDQSQRHFSTSISLRSLSASPIVRLPNHVRTINARRDQAWPLVRWLRLRSEFQRRQPHLRKCLRTFYRPTVLLRYVRNWRRFSFHSSGSDRNPSPRPVQRVPVANSESQRVTFSVLLLAPRAADCVTFVSLSLLI